MVSHRISSPASEADDGPLLIDFLNNAPNARVRFCDLHSSKVQRIAGRIAPDLNQRDLSGDVVSEFWLLLLEKKPNYFRNPNGPVWAQLTLLIYTAASRVRRQNRVFLRPADERTIKKAIEKVIAESGLSESAFDNASEYTTGDDLFPKLSGGHPGTNDDWDGGIPVAPDTYVQSDISRTNNRMVCEQVLRDAQANAKPYVQVVLASVYYDDTTRDEAADKIGVTRWTLRRGMK